MVSSQHLESKKILRYFLPLRQRNFGREISPWTSEATVRTVFGIDKEKCPLQSTTAAMPAMGELENTLDNSESESESDASGDDWNELYNVQRDHLRPINKSPVVVSSSMPVAVDHRRPLPRPATIADPPLPLHENWTPGDAKIPKPKGQVGRRSGRGYDLRTKLPDWNDETYEKVNSFITSLVDKHLDSDRSYSKQTKEARDAVRTAAKAEFPWLDHYDNDWVINNFIQKINKTSHQRAKRAGERLEQEIASKRRRVTITTTTTTT